VVQRPAAIQIVLSGKEPRFDLQIPRIESIVRNYSRAPSAASILLAKHRPQQSMATVYGNCCIVRVRHKGTLCNNCPPRHPGIHFSRASGLDETHRLPPWALRTIDWGFAPGPSHEAQKTTAAPVSCLHSPLRRSTSSLSLFNVRKLPMHLSKPLSKTFEFRRKKFSTKLARRTPNGEDVPLDASNRGVGRGSCRAPRDSFLCRA
jgi:hypothetical protein